MKKIVAACATPSGGQECLWGEFGHQRDPADQLARNTQKERGMKRRTFMAGVTATGLSLVSGKAGMAQDAGTATPAGGETMTRTDVQSGYAPVNGLEMYYEIHAASGGGGLTPGQFQMSHRKLQPVGVWRKGRAR